MFKPSHCHVFGRNTFRGWRHISKIDRHWLKRASKHCSDRTLEVKFSMYFALINIFERQSRNLIVMRKATNLYIISCVHVTTKEEKIGQFRLKCHFYLPLRKNTSFYHNCLKDKYFPHFYVKCLFHMMQWMLWRRLCHYVSLYAPDPFFWSIT